MNQYKYYVKGTVKGSKCYETHTEDMYYWELLDYAEEIQDLFTKDPVDELAQYIHDDCIIHGVVTEIWVSVKIIDKIMYSWTEVTANRSLTDIEKGALLDYLTGQFSDGYGEGLEQQEFGSETEYESEEVWDEESQEYYEDEWEVRADMYLHLWQPKGFQLELVEDKKDYSWLKCAVEDGDISLSEFNIAKNIDFNINGEDYGLFLGQIKDFLKIEDIKNVSYYILDSSIDFDGAYQVVLKNGQTKLFGWKDFQSGLEEIIEIIKPKCKLIGEDGNIFNLMGIASRTLQRAGLSDKADEMKDRIINSNSYSEALSIICEYVKVE